MDDQYFINPLSIYNKIKEILGENPNLKDYVDACIYAAFGNYYFFRPTTLEELINFLDTNSKNVYKFVRSRTRYNTSKCGV